MQRGQVVSVGGYNVLDRTLCSESRLKRFSLYLSGVLTKSFPEARRVAPRETGADCERVGGEKEV